MTVVDPQDTVNQLAARLGLEPPGTYQPSPIAKLKKRHLGRSTNMILWALVDVIHGRPVCFMASTRERAAEIVYRARDYARVVGLDVALIRRPLPYGMASNPREWPKGVKVFKDHSLNYGGGPAREPKESCSSGEGGFDVGCPWCGRSVKNPFPLSDAFKEGSRRVIMCNACIYPIEVHVERVRVTLKAWRAAVPEDVRREWETGLNEAAG